MENTEIIKTAKAKAEAWLNDAYDQKTREAVKKNAGCSRFHRIG